MILTRLNSFNMQFGGHDIVVTAKNVVSCPGKRVKVYVPFLRLFMEDKKKRVVGYSEDTTLSMERRILYAWAVDGKIHIGCLTEPEDKAKEVYIEIIKQTNKQHG